jgi:uncharacterized protein
MRRARHSCIADGATPGIRACAAIHRELIKSGHLGPEWGRAFDRLFESRQRADYLAFGEFEAAEVDKLIADATAFVNEMHALARR